GLRIVHAYAPLAPERGQVLAQRPVRADAARDDEAREPRGRERVAAFGRQRVDDRGLERRRDVGARALVELAALAARALDREPRRRLQAAEAHVEALVFERPRER